jgi:bifunctional N-acetylglucosamine-1-phosphate-uridyltransferase/glucosamine-1-phosphate-acetyltransferase GlmU-like protein
MVEKVLAPAGFGRVVRERAGRLWTETEHKERERAGLFLWQTEQK